MRRIAARFLRRRDAVRQRVAGLRPFVMRGPRALREPVVLRKRVVQDAGRILRRGRGAAGVRDPGGGRRRCDELDARGLGQDAGSLGSRRAGLRVRIQAPQAEGRDLAGNVGRERGRVRRRSTGQRFLKDHAQGVDVGRRARGRAVQQFRGDIGGRAEDGGAGRGRARERDAEIEDLHPDRGEEHVRGLDVAVDDPRGVGRGQGVRHAGAGRGGLVPGQRPPGQAGRQGLAVQQLHDDVGDAPVLAVVVNAGDVRMVESRGRLRLLAQPLRVTLRPSPLRDLDRDGPIEDGVGGAPDDRHAAGVEGPLQAVAVPENLPGDGDLGHGPQPMPSSRRNPGLRRSTPPRRAPHDPDGQHLDSSPGDLYRTTPGPLPRFPDPRRNSSDQGA